MSTQRWPSVSLAQPRPSVSCASLRSAASTPLPLSATTCLRKSASLRNSRKRFLTSQTTCKSPLAGDAPAGCAALCRRRQDTGDEEGGGRQGNQAHRNPTGQCRCLTWPVRRKYEGIAARPAADMVDRMANRRGPGLSCGDAGQLLPRAQIRRRAGDAARIPHADGGDAGRPGRPPGRGLLLSVARRAGEGRAQPRQVRPRVRPRLQGARPAERRGRGRHSGRVAQEADRPLLHRGGEEADRGDGRPRQADRDAEEAPRRAEGPPPGRQQVDRHRRHLAVRRTTATTRRACASARTRTATSAR